MNDQPNKIPAPEMSASAECDLQVLTDTVEQYLAAHPRVKSAVYESGEVERTLTNSGEGVYDPIELRSKTTSDGQQVEYEIVDWDGTGRKVYKWFNSAGAEGVVAREYAEIITRPMADSDYLRALSIPEAAFGKLGQTDPAVASRKQSIWSKLGFAGIRYKKP